MKYTRIYADSEGDTHFEVVEDESQVVELAPKVAMILSEKMSAKAVCMASLPAGYSDEFHPAPAIYLVAYLQGEVEITVTDGEIRKFKPGDISLQSDVEGRGHKNRIVGGSVCRFLLIELDR